MVDKMKAYPFQHKNPTSGLVSESQGMDLRDYFACACFEKIGSFPQTLNVDIGGNLTEKQQSEFDRYIKGASRLAYLLADAMMEARNANN